MLRCAFLLSFLVVLAACGESGDRAQKQPEPTVIVVPAQMEKNCDADCQAVLRARREHDERPPKW